jgi:hypothetical protein
MTDQEPTQVYQPPTGDPAAPPPAVATAPAVEPPPAPVATAPLESASNGARPGRSKLRWLVAGLVVLLVAGTAAGATLLLTSDSGDPAVLAYTPADSVAYAELRLDLPGSQSAELAEIMKAFPGFEDQAAFPVKLSEALDLLVGQATDGQQSYKNDVEPWFGGQIGASAGPLPSTADPAAARGVVLLSVKDAAKATAWAEGVVAKSGAATTTETHNGVAITIVEPAAGAVPDAAGMKAAYAVVGPVLAIGDPTSVKAVIDTGGKTGLNTNAQFKEAEASVTGDRLGFAYADLAALAKSATDLAGSVTETMPSLPISLEGLTPPWVAGAVSAKDGAFVMESRSPHLEAAGPPSNSESKLPGVVPPTTVLLVEGHDVGKTIASFKDQLAEVPELKDPIAQLDDALAIVGGPEAVTGWIGEAGVAVTLDGGEVSGGLVIVPTDAGAADKLLGQLKAFIQLGGAQAGLSVTEEQYNGTTITVVDLSGLGGLVGTMSQGAVAAPADLKLAYAVTDQVVVFGIGTEFVKSVIDASAGESLADTERFSTALTQAGKEHASLFWLDVASARDFIEGMVPASDRSDYDANLKPYLQAFDTVIGTTTPGAEIDSATVIIRVTGN